MSVKRVQNNGSGPFSIDCLMTRFQNYSLRRTVVNHDQNRIKALGDREVSDEVHRGKRKGTKEFGLYWLKWGCGRVVVDLVLLTGCAAIDIISYENGKAWPPIMLSNKFLGS